MNSSDFRPTSELEHGPSYEDGADAVVSSHQYPDQMTYASVQFPSDFVSADGSEGMLYQGFPDQFMPMVKRFADNVFTIIAIWIHAIRI